MGSGGLLKHGMEAEQQKLQSYMEVQIAMIVINVGAKTVGSK